MTLNSVKFSSNYNHFYHEIIPPIYRGLADQLNILRVLTLSKDGSYMLVSLASPRWRLCPGEYLLVSYRISMLYNTSEYSPGHQRHLVEANKSILDPPFDEVIISRPLKAMLSDVNLWMGDCSRITQTSVIIINELYYRTAHFIFTRPIL